MEGFTSRRKRKMRINDEVVGKSSLDQVCGGNDAISRTSRCSRLHALPVQQIVAFLLLFMVATTQAELKFSDVADFCLGPNQGVGRECFPLESLSQEMQPQPFDPTVDTSRLGAVCLEVIQTHSGEVQLEVNYQAGSGWAIKDAHFWLGKSPFNVPMQKTKDSKKLPDTSRFPFKTNLAKMEDPAMRTTTVWNEVISADSNNLVVCNIGGNGKETKKRLISAQAVMVQLDNPGTEVTAFAALNPQDEFDQRSDFFVVCHCPETMVQEAMDAASPVEQTDEDGVEYPGALTDPNDELEFQEEAEKAESLELSGSHSDETDEQTVSKAGEEEQEEELEEEDEEELEEEVKKAGGILSWLSGPNETKREEDSTDPPEPSAPKEEEETKYKTEEESADAPASATTKEDEEWEEAQEGSVDVHSSDSSGKDPSSSASDNASGSGSGRASGSSGSGSESSSDESSDSEDEGPPVMVKADELELTTSFIVVMPDQKHYLDMLLDEDTLHKTEEQIEASPQLHEAWHLFVAQLMSDFRIPSVNATVAVDHERRRDLKAVTVEWIEDSPDLFKFLITTPCPAHILDTARRGVEFGSNPKSLVRGNRGDDSSRATCYKAFGKYKVLHLNPDDELDELDEDFQLGQSRQEVCYDIFHMTRRALKKEKLGQDLATDVPFLIQSGKPESCLPTGHSTVVARPHDIETSEAPMDSSDYPVTKEKSILYELRNDDGTWNSLRVMEFVAYLTTSLLMMALCITIYCFFLPKIDLESRNRVTDDWSQPSLRPQRIRAQKLAKNEPDYFPWLE